MKISFVVCVAVLSANVIYAQQAQRQSQELEWAVKQVPSNVADGYQYERGFSNSVIYTEANEAISAVRFTDKEFGLVKVNSSGKVLWELRLMNGAIGLGYLNKQVIVFFCDEDEKNSQLHAALIDPGTGKKSVDKIVYDHRGETTVEYKVQNKNGGQFNDLLVRVTGNNEKQSYFGAGTVARSLQTEKCAALYFDDNLNVVKTTVLRGGADYQFLGSLISEDGTIYICSRTEEDLAVEQFDQLGQVASRLLTGLPYKKMEGTYPAFAIDKNNSNRVLAAVRYKSKDNGEQIQLFGFDMKGKKVSKAAEEILTKAYSKEINLQEISGTMGANFSKIVEELRPIEILQAGDKIIVLKEVKLINVGSNSTRLFNGPLVISFYDQDLKLLKHTGINKGYEVFVNIGRSLGYHLNGDQLEIVTGTLTGVAAAGDIYCQLDTKTMSFTKAGLLDKGSLGRTISSEPNSTMWFSGSFVVNYVLPKGLFRSKKIVSTVLQEFKY